MNHEDLRNIFDQHYKRMKEFARNNFHNLERNSIHQFRIECKKIRAFLRMLSESKASNCNLKVSNNLRQTYRIAGIIRDLQLHIAQCRKSTNNCAAAPDAYLKLLQKKIHKQRSKLKAGLVCDSIEKSRKKTDHILPGSFTLKNYIHYVQKKQDKIYSILGSGRFNRENLHAIRKILKDLFYNCDALNEAISHGSILKGFQSIKINPAVKSLQDDLGTFQDQCSSLAFLDKRFLHTLKRKDRKQLSETKNQLTEVNKNSKRNIAIKLEALMETASILSFN